MDIAAMREEKGDDAGVVLMGSLVTSRYLYSNNDQYSKLLDEVTLRRVE
jgi:hypothetical protein